MTSTRKMKLGMSIGRHGYHVAGWRMPGAVPDALLRPEQSVALAQIAERGLFDMVFFADVAAAENVESAVHARDKHHLVVKHDPMMLLPAIAMMTKAIGLVSTISTSYHHPYRVARSLASLDSISHGRGGWNLVTSYSPSESANYGIEKMPAQAERYARAHEFVEVVKGLWDSWEDDAFLCDPISGQYYDPSKLHILGHKGDHFAVRGPLDVARSPQGRPVIVTAGDSEAMREMAAAHAEVLYAASNSLKAAQSYYSSVKSRLSRYGRAPDELLIMPALMVYVAPSREEAHAKEEQLQALIHPEVGVGMLEQMFGDLRGYDIDGPLPEVTKKAAQWARIDFADTLLKRARDEGLSIRKVYELVCSGAHWHIAKAGTPADIVDLMQEWFESGAADGFNVQPAYTPVNAIDFVELVIPELQRRGLFRTQYEATTLRGNLGLPPRSHQVVPRSAPAAE